MGTAGTLKSITNKIVYAEMTTSFPPPKVVMESSLDYSLTWSRLHNAVVDAGARDGMYLLIHNKLPVPERLFRIRVKNDPYCQTCVGAVIADSEHFFTKCEGIVGSWTLVKNEILRYGDLSSNVLYVWNSVYVRGADVRTEQFFGFLRYKYKELQTGSSNHLKNLQLLN